MRKKLLLLIIFISISCYSQSDKIVFTYDLAGNQGKRSLCLNCPATTGKNTTVKDFTEVTDQDMVKMADNDAISYYPNPVKEELYIAWENTEHSIITSIQVFSITGQLLAVYENISKSQSQNIPFQSFPSGVYVLLFDYTNKDQKSIKIIKQ